MNEAKCPKCSNMCERINDAAHVQKATGELKTIGGWYCEWCTFTWFKEKKSKAFKAAARAANKARYGKKLRVNSETLGT